MTCNVDKFLVQCKAVYITLSKNQQDKMLIRMLEIKLMVPDSTRAFELEGAA